ncbi:DUF1439 domain-containing protein [Lacisediminimonas profundi]|uniref:DUF1439 domain-containing protein n=1 Tax=Lacisediminimonas profundi TaxID=2603856 RepID=UPI00124B9509|nr:DUF1439 domain-containing protein [Lacisediminimonas profundi]
MIKKYLTLAAMLVLAGCSTLLGPRTVELSLAQLQEALGRRLPLDSRYLELFDVRLDNPRLTLQEGRLGIALDAAVKPRMMQTGWSGRLALSGVPRIDLGKRAVMLGQVKVDNLTINGLSPAYSQQLVGLGNALAARLVTDLPLYTFGASDFQYAATSFQPTNINTAAKGLVITFEPVR